MKSKIRQNHMNCKNKFLLRFFIMLFTISVSAAIMPSETVNLYGLFGEVQSSTATEENKKDTEERTSVFKKCSIVRGINEYNIWLVIAAVILFLILSLYVINLPKRDTIITLKVKMTN